MNKPKLYEWTVANANGDCCTGITAGNMVEQMNRDAPDRGPWTFVSKVEVQEKPEGGVLRKEHVDAVIEHGRKVLAGEVPSAAPGPLLASAKVHHLISSAIGKANEPTPYSIELESERAEIVKHYGVMRPDGAMGGTTYTDKEDAEEEVALLLEGFAEGRASAMKRMEKLEADLERVTGALYISAGEVNALRDALESVTAMAADMTLVLDQNTPGIESFPTLKKHVGVGASAMAVLAAHPAASLDALQEQAIERVRRERKRQDEKWGEQNHGPDRWSLILTEETGEVAKAALDRDHKAYIAELVQVAAVALAALECAARGAGAEEGHAEECQQVYPLALAQMVAGAVWAEAAPDRPIDTERCVAIVDRVLATQVADNGAEGA